MGDHRGHFPEPRQRVLFADTCLELQARRQIVQNAGEVAFTASVISPTDRWTGKSTVAPPADDLATDADDLAVAGPQVFFEILIVLVTMGAGISIVILRPITSPAV